MTWITPTADWDLKKRKFKRYVRAGNRLVKPASNKLILRTRKDKLVVENKELDLGPIEARLTGSMLAGLKIECFRVSYDDDILIGYEEDPTTPTSFEIMTSYREEFFRNAPTDIIALIAEVKRLRGDGLKEYNWNDIDGYGGGYDYTVVASSLEEAREFAKKRFTGPGGSDSFLKYVYNTKPDIYDFSPKGKGYYEYHMDAGG